MRSYPSLSSAGPGPHPSKPVGTVFLGLVRGFRAARHLEVGRIGPAIRGTEAVELDLGQLEDRDRLLALEVLLAGLEHGWKSRPRGSHGLDLDFLAVEATEEFDRDIQDGLAIRRRQQRV